MRDTGVTTVKRPHIIGSRPLRIAVGAGHHNATGGHPDEIGLTGPICRAVVALAHRSDGFAVRCYTPGDGVGMHSGAVDAGPGEVAAVWDPVWPVDLFHEIHVQAVPERPDVRGVFVIYPDAPGITVDGTERDDIDRDVQATALVMSQRIAAATGLPVGGPESLGIMSEQQTLFGRRGRRLRIFAATATTGMLAHSCRFITEIGSSTSPEDAEILHQPSFPRRAAAGILEAYAALAVSRMGWSYPYRIGDPDEARDLSP
jgi:hypothetical protein